MNALLSPALIGAEFLRIIKDAEARRRHPLFRRGISNSHRRKLLKQKGLSSKGTISIRIPPRYVS